MEGYNNGERQIINLLRDVSREKNEIDEEIILEIYRLEEDLSTLDRRHGIRERIRNIIESFAE